MLIQGTIKCPMCKKENCSLEFWRKSNNHFFHICALCKSKTHKYEDDLLDIGYWHGYYKAMEDFREKIGGLEP